LTVLSVSIGMLTFLAFLYIKLITPSVEIPQMRLSGYDPFVVFLFIGNLIQLRIFVPVTEDNLLLLNSGFSSANMAAFIWTSIAALYLVYVFLSGRFQIVWLLRRPYFWIFVLIVVYLSANFWSIFPLYTLFRSYDLVVWVGLAIYFFTRLKLSMQKVAFLALYCLTWFLLYFPTFIESFSEGIIFSSIKDNLIPAAGFATVVLGWTTRWRLVFCAIGMGAFIVAGSAASVAGGVAACFAGLTLNRSIIFKLVGYVGLVATLAFMVVYLFFPEDFPQTVELVSNLLHKPSEELIGATGRYGIWSAFWELTQNNYFGTGFGSDRFGQLLGNASLLSERVEAMGIDFLSAHNAVLGAWVAAGWPGLIGLLFAIVAGLRCCAKSGSVERTATMMVLVFITINSLSTSALGGRYSVQWLVWIATLSIAAGQKHNYCESSASALPRTNSRIGFTSTGLRPRGATIRQPISQRGATS
jgi:exopolysaccharide production protein ExoQ